MSKGNVTRNILLRLLVLKRWRGWKFIYYFETCKPNEIRLSKFGALNDHINWTWSLNINELTQSSQARVYFINSRPAENTNVCVK